MDAIRPSAPRNADVKWVSDVSHRLARVSTGGLGMASGDLCLKGFAVAPGYSTSDSALLDDFFVPALERSCKYDRAVGFFSSSLVALASVTMADFVGRGGKMRLVCSPHLSETDLAWLGLEQTSPHATHDDVVANISALARADDLAGALITAMSSLVAHGSLEVKFARPIYGFGIFHDKVGIFSDTCDDRLTFVGSANETAAAWSGLGNHEQIETFATWLGPEQASRVDRHFNQFQELWMGGRRGVKVSPADAAKALLMDVAAPDNVEVALEQVKRILKSRSHESQVHGSDEQRPRRVLRPHQIEVLESWRRMGRSGLVVFATGGGKTITGLAAAREWLEEGKPVMIAVPSTLLLKQWFEEIQKDIPEASVLLAGGGNPRATWEGNLRLFTEDGHDLGPRITLTTYDTGVTDDFQTLALDGDHLLIIADEVHRVGAPDRQRFLSLTSGARMGLSATPERYGDPQGTQAIFDYFGSRLSPEFGLREAIECGQLVPYEFDFVTTPLLDQEQEAWDAFSAEMARELARNKGEMTERFQRLARDRSRILKTAANKAGIARRVLDERQKPGDKWLVYCDSLEHLRCVREAIETPERRVLEYHSQNSRLSQEIFDCFEEGGVLLAIRCLDEGVDLPFINKALILASTTNPREYIQRRGRVLRRFPGKYSAEIVDVLVVDDQGLPLVTAEARRALEFAENAANLAGKARLEILLGRALNQDAWRRDDRVIEMEGE